MRRNKLSGFSARLGYRSAFGTSDFSWQAGLVLDGLKSRQEASGQLTVGAAIESIAVTPEKTKIRPGGFAGVYSEISEDISLELNLFTVSYSRVNWVPQTYSGRPAAAEYKDRMGFALECAIGFRF